MMNTVLAAAVPALLSGTGGAGGSAGFDAVTIIEGMVTSAQSQLYSIIGIVAPVLGAITVAIVLVKNGAKWIKRLGAA